MIQPNSVDDPSDAHWLRYCLELAQRGMGKTAPNPMVGAVVVNQGEKVGEGFHPGVGLPHAEVFALRAAGDRARGGTLYVNLEPCNHTGRTPPCTEAILRSGIRRVVTGMVDPDPRVSGSGLERLRSAGLEVRVGVAEAECRRLNEGFIHRITRHRPLGLWKYAMTLDGKIATSTGHSQWITGPVARAEVHRLRASCDAVVVGGHTVRCDNPQLTTHGQSPHNPRRVVLSRRLDLPIPAQLWSTDVAPTLVFTTAMADPQQVERLRELGVEVVIQEPLSPAQVTDHLYQRGCATVLWECGGTLAAQAIADQVIDKVWAFIAPKLIGGAQAPTPLGDLGITHMASAIGLNQVTHRQVGEDWLMEAYLDQAAALSTPIIPTEDKVETRLVNPMTDQPSRPPGTPCAIALGSNLGDSLNILESALEHLAQTPGITLLKVSPWYQTSPLGSAQPDYLNGCALLEVTLSPQAVLVTLLSIENQFGRVRQQRWGPRTLDLDLLLYGDLVLETADLIIPHPRMAERAFVLVPLAAIAPDLMDPRSGLTISQLLDQVDRTGVELLSLTSD